MASWLKNLVSRGDGDSKATVAHAGVENTMYYDQTRKRWVQRGKEHEADAAQDAGPPPMTKPIKLGGGPPSVGNTRSAYIDPFAQMGIGRQTPVPVERPKFVFTPVIPDQSLLAQGGDIMEPEAPHATPQDVAQFGEQGQSREDEPLQHSEPAQAADQQHTDHHQMYQPPHYNGYIAPQDHQLFNQGPIQSQGAVEHPSGHFFEPYHHSENTLRETKEYGNNHQEPHDPRETLAPIHHLVDHHQDVHYHQDSSERLEQHYHHGHPSADHKIETVHEPHQVGHEEQYDHQFYAHQDEAQVLHSQVSHDLNHDLGADHYYEGPTMNSPPSPGHVIHATPKHGNFSAPLNNTLLDPSLSTQDFARVAERLSFSRPFEVSHHMPVLIQIVTTSTHSSVSASALSALWNVLDSDDSSAESLIPIIIHCMKVHSNDALVIATASGVLSLLAIKHAEFILKNGGLDAAVAGIKSHEGKARDFCSQLICVLGARVELGNGVEGVQGMVHGKWAEILSIYTGQHH